jgi:hypothetical protein
MFANGFDERTEHVREHDQVTSPTNDVTANVMGDVSCLRNRDENPPSG